MKDWFAPANILQMVYILGTLIFSYLIWSATREGAKATKAATDASNASLNLAKELNERAKKLDDDLAEQYRKDLYIQSLLIFNVAMKLKAQITSTELAKLPTEIKFGNVQAAKYLNKDEKIALR